MQKGGNCKVNRYAVFGNYTTILAKVPKLAKPLQGIKRPFPRRCILRLRSLATPVFHPIAGKAFD